MHAVNKVVLMAYSLGAMVAPSFTGVIGTAKGAIQPTNDNTISLGSFNQSYSFFTGGGSSGITANQLWGLYIGGSESDYLSINKLFYIYYDTSSFQWGSTETSEGASKAIVYDMAISLVCDERIDGALYSVSYVLSFKMTNDKDLFCYQSSFANGVRSSTGSDFTSTRDYATASMMSNGTIRRKLGCFQTDDPNEVVNWPTSIALYGTYLTGWSDYVVSVYNNGYNDGEKFGENNISVINWLNGAMGVVDSALSIPVLGKITIANVIGAMFSLSALLWIISWFR